MKQLTCPSCATVLEHPNGSGESTLTCPLCGEKVRLSRPGSSARKAAAAAQGAAPPPKSRAAVKPVPLPPLPVAPRSRAAGNTPPPRPVPAVARSQSRPAPAPAARTGSPPWLWIAALTLLLVIAGGVVWLVLHQRKPVAPIVTPEPAPSSQPEPRPESRPSPSSEPEAEVPEPTGPAAGAQVREVVRIDPRGDATVQRYYQFTARDYSAVKGAVSQRSSSHLLRDLGLRKHWQEIHDFHVECSDPLQAVVVRWKVRGLARLADSQLWEAPLAEEQGLSLLSSHDNEGIFTGKREMQLLGATDVLPLTLVVRGPRGSSKVQLLSAPARVGFRLPPQDTTAARGAAPRFEVQAKANLMACAGRVYGQRKFGRFWTARSVLENRSGQALHDYSVRFRLGDYASSWQAFACPLVLPGQMVVDAYYPVLDNRKLAAEADTVQALMEVEYQYRQDDGQVVRKTETRTVRVLNRNQVLSTSLAAHECADMRDESEDIHEVLATLVVPNDPVIKEVEGRVINGLVKHGIDDDPVHVINRPPDPRRPPANGLSTATDPVDAYLLLKGLYYFMSRHIVYNHPPGDTFDRLSSQSILYGRDVLKNHAGTCIDLAVLVASVAAAGDVDASLILVKGHCFPVLCLPRPILVPLFDKTGKIQVNEKGKVALVELQEIGVEATCIKSLPFEAALMIGTQEWQEHCKKGDYLRVRIARDHAQGRRPLSLPTLSLKDCDLNEDGSWAQLIPGGVRPQNRQPQGGQPQGGRQEEGKPQPAASVVGRWHASGRCPNGNSYDARITLGKDGSFKYVDVQYRTAANGVSMPVANVVLTGTYKVGAAAITLTTEQGTEIVWQYRLLGNDRLLASPLHAAARGLRFDFLRLE